MKPGFLKRIRLIWRDVKSEIYIATLFGIALMLSITLGVTTGFAIRNQRVNQLKTTKYPIASKESHIFLKRDSIFIEDLPVTMDEMETTLWDLKSRKVIDTVRIIPDKSVTRDRIDNILAVLKRVGIEHIILEGFSSPWIQEKPDDYPSIAKEHNSSPGALENSSDHQIKPDELETNFPDTKPMDLTQVIMSNPMPKVAIETVPVNNGKVEKNSYFDGSEIKTDNAEDSSFGSSPVIDTSSIKASYQKRILEKVDRMKIYPPIARRMGHEGRMLVSFTVNGNGTIGDLVIAQKSSYGELDFAALDTVRRAVPFETIPSELNVSSMEISLVINFDLNN